MQLRTWDDFREELVLSYQADRRAKKTITKLKQVFDEMAEFVTTTADLTFQNLQRWKLSRPNREPITFNGLMAYLRAICNQAIALGYLDKSPFVGVRYRLKVRRNRKRKHLSRDEVGRLLAYLEVRQSLSWKDGRLYALTMLLAHTGLRAMEALQLRVEDVDLQTGLLEVVARQDLKTVESEATIPIPPAIVPCLAAWKSRCGSEWLFPGARRRGPWIYGSNGKRPADNLDDAGIAAGLPQGTTLLMLRHTFATHARAGFRLGAKEVKQILRHTTELTQEHYCHEDMDHLRREVERIDFRKVG
jgi:integrase